MSEYIPSEIEKAIMRQREEAFSCARAGDLVQYEAKMLAMWNLIPEPKTAYQPEAQGVLLDFIEMYQNPKDLNNPVAALPWLPHLERAYEAGDEMVAEIQGRVYYDVGQLDEAFAKFDYVYKRMGRRFFEGGDKKYLNFYLERVAAQKAK